MKKYNEKLKAINQNLKSKCESQILPPQLIKKLSSSVLRQQEKLELRSRAIYRVIRARKVELSKQTGQL